MTGACVDQETIELYFYGEGDRAMRDGLEAHLRGCASCRAQLNELTTIRSLLAERAAAADAADWRPQLDARIDALSASAARHALTPAAPVRWRGSAQAFAAAAVLLLMVGSVASVGWQLHRAVALTTKDQYRQGERELAVSAVASRHLQRSKLVVLGLMAKDPADPAVDWSYERQLASTLWPETRLYRSAATREGLPGLAKALGDLEVVLLQTALTEHPDGDALGTLQRLIRARDLRLTIDTLERRTSGDPGR